MKLNVPTLNRLSPLFDEELELDHAHREVWLSKLESEQADLIPILRELLGAVLFELWSGTFPYRLEHSSRAAFEGVVLPIEPTRQQC